VSRDVFDLRRPIYKLSKNQLFEISKYFHYFEISSFPIQFFPNISNSKQISQTCLIIQLIIQACQFEHSKLYFIVNAGMWRTADLRLALALRCAWAQVWKAVRFALRNFMCARLRLALFLRFAPAPCAFFALCACALRFFVMCAFIHNLYIFHMK